MAVLLLVKIGVKYQDTQGIFNFSSGMLILRSSSALLNVSSSFSQSIKL